MNQTASTSGYLQQVDPTRLALLTKITELENEIKAKQKAIGDIKQALEHFPDPFAQVPYTVTTTSAAQAWGGTPNQCT